MMSALLRKLEREGRRHISGVAVRHSFLIVTQFLERSMSVWSEIPKRENQVH